MREFSKAVLVAGLAWAAAITIPAQRADSPGFFLTVDQRNRLHLVHKDAGNQ